MDAVIVLCGSSASRDMAKWQREVEAADTAGTGVRATSLTAETFHGLSGECWHCQRATMRCGAVDRV